LEYLVDFALATLNFFLNFSRKFCPMLTHRWLPALRRLDVGLFGLGGRGWVGFLRFGLCRGIPHGLLGVLVGSPLFWLLFRLLFWLFFLFFIGGLQGFS
jgi:hypothetical protein